MEELEFISRKEKKQFIWVEKYRPKQIEDYIGNPMIKEIFSRYVRDQDFCHLLLYGGPGTGKTTLAKMLVSQISCDYIYINASDERGIDTIRDKIKVFASSCGFKALKAVILDEADFLTPAAQASLRPMMETYALHTRFILTGNYHEKILDPIKSRLQSFKLEPPSKKDVALNLVKILDSEGVKYKKEDIAEIINAYYPDIRKTIQVSQQFTNNGELNLIRTELVANDIKNKIVEMLSVRSGFTEIRKFIIEQGITRFEDIYEHLYENIDKFAEKKVASVVLCLAEGVKNDALVSNKQIVFLACLIEILKNLKE